MSPGANVINIRYTVFRKKLERSIKLNEFRFLFKNVLAFLRKTGLRSFITLTPGGQFHEHLFTANISENASSFVK